MKTRKIFFVIFAVITLAIQTFIIVESCIDGGNSGAQSSGFSQVIIDVVKSINPEAEIVLHPEKFHSVIRKLFGHFLLFGGFGFFMMLTLSMLEDAYKSKKIEIILSCSAYGIAIALLSEFIQLFIPGRGGDILDVLIDLGGYVLFSFAIFLILFIINNIREKKNVSTLG